MLKRLHIQNFTVFADAELEFGPGLNVIVGTNGTGKSHVLKLGYVAARVTARILGDEGMAPGPDNWEVYLSERLKDVFQPEELSKLVRWNAEVPTASIVADFDDYYENLAFNFSVKPDFPFDYWNHPVNVDNHPTNSRLNRAIFIPPKEVLTLLWLRSIYKRRVLPIDDTYPALLDLLSEIPLRHPSDVANIVLTKLGEILGGHIEVDGDRSYIVSAKRKLDMNLAAEGLRKFAMLERLLRNGVLTPENPLFWDEPEANLNPQLLRELAKILAELARHGFQIILATHSMSLLKQFHILSRQPTETPLPIYYFGLNAQTGQPTTIIRRDNFEYLPDVVALEVELEQADDLEEVFAREDRHNNADHSRGR